MPTGVRACARTPAFGASATPARNIPPMTTPRMSRFIYGFLRLATHEIGRVVDAPASGVRRHLRIRAQRTHAIDLPVGAVRGVQLLRRLAVLHPLLERADLVEHVRALTAGAV